jgi:hypothetical protein
MQDKRQTTFDRRNFLRVFGGASAAAIAGTTTATLIPEEAQAYDPGEQETRSRYRETANVKAFYRVNGYEH